MVTATCIQIGPSGREVAYIPSLILTFILTSIAIDVVCRYRPTSIDPLNSMSASALCGKGLPLTLGLQLGHVGSTKLGADVDGGWRLLGGPAKRARAETEGILGGLSELQELQQNPSPSLILA